MFTEYEYRMPAVLVSALINCDYTGLRDDEAIKFDKFLTTLPGQGHWSMPDDEDTFFTPHHDMKAFGWLADDCVNISWMKRN